MAFNWRHPGIVWLEHTGENAVRSAALVALSLMTPGGQTHAPWQAIVLLSVKGALYAVLLSVATNVQSNGTDSFLPRVVAEPKTPRGETV